MRVRSCLNFCASGEVVETGPVDVQRGAPVEQLHAITGGEFADAGDRAFDISQPRRERVDLFRRHGETQLAVLAAGQCQATRTGFAGMRAQCRRDRHQCGGWGPWALKRDDAQFTDCPGRCEQRRLSLLGRYRCGFGRDVKHSFELHRNGWPHLHALIEHASWGADDLAGALGGWSLGRWDARDVSLDDAIGEVAPYLVSGERKSGGSKAYQFAGVALPPGFRLHSSSRNFLGGVLESEDEKPDYGVTLRGHFASYHQALKEMGADARLCLYPPSEGEYVPPARTVAYGDVALVYFAELVSAKALHVHPGAVGAILDRRSDSG